MNTAQKSISSDVADQEWKFLRHDFKRIQDDPSRLAAEQNIQLTVVKQSEPMNRSALVITDKSIDDNWRLIQ